MCLSTLRSSPAIVQCRRRDITRFLPTISGAYPYGAIGEVTFMWRPRFEHSNDRVLWVWCHPEIRELLLDAFRLPPESAEDSETPSSTPEGELVPFLLCL